jgi:hypothetical protein
MKPAEVNKEILALLGSFPDDLKQNYFKIPRN